MLWICICCLLGKSWVAASRSCLWFWCFYIGNFGLSWYLFPPCHVSHHFYISIKCTINTEQEYYTDFLYCLWLDSTEWDVWLCHWTAIVDSGEGWVCNGIQSVLSSTAENPRTTSSAVGGTAKPACTRPQEARLTLGTTFEEYQTKLLRHSQPSVYCRIVVLVKTESAAQHCLQFLPKKQCL